MRTRLHFHNRIDEKKLRSVFSPATSIVVFDRKLLTVVPGFRRWLKAYPHSFALSGGEKLKSMKSFARECNRIQRAVGDQVTRQWTVVAIGGGSIGDFAGFFASVYRRGLRLVHIPTTWLAAIDSSHGGKTALNLSGVKNQIGTFYPSTDTILIRSILQLLPEKNLDDAVGELVKIALIDGRTWAKNLKRPKGSRTKQAQWFWRQLPNAIESKLRIVRRDPLEVLGDRQILNLGHTFGHVIESDRRLAHGRSVALGLLFALEFSESETVISSTSANAIRVWLAQNGIVNPKKSELVSMTQARRLLARDKKRAEGRDVWFILLRGFGKAERRRVDVDRLLEFAEASGWLK